MAITETLRNGDGTLGPFPFDFKWLESTDVKVSVGGVLKTAGTDYNLQALNYATRDGGEVLFTAGNAPPVGIENIRIYRETDDTTLTASFVSGSAIRAQDLNENFLQSIYVAQETKRDAEAATAEVTQGVADAALALSNSQTAITTANNAETVANTANATANSANATAATATTTATTATNTANTALNAANQAVTIADSASSTATSAQTSATNAVNTANAADATANQALDLVSAVVDYDIISNVAAIPGSPADGDGVELLDSTGIQSFSPLTGIPAGFIGSGDLRVKIRYNATGSTWEWVSYVAADPESRYVNSTNGVISNSLGIGTASAAQALHVVGTSQFTSTNTVYINPNFNTEGVAFQNASNVPTIFTTNNQERARIDTSGRLLVGTSGYRSVGDPFLPSNVIFNEGSSISTYQVFAGVHNRADSVGPQIVLGKSRGETNGSVTIVQDNDTLGEIAFAGADGNDLEARGALITAQVDGTPGANTMPSRLAFGTTSATPGAGPTTRMTIKADGNVGIGTTTPGEALEVTGNIAVSPNPGSFRVIGAGLSSDTTVVLQSGGASGTGGNIELGRDGVIVYDATNHIFRNVSGAGEYARIDSGGRLLVGTTSANQVPTGEGVNRQPYLQVGSNTYEASALSSILYAPDAIGGGSISLARSNTSTIGDQAIANSGDVVGSVFFSASDGAKQVRCAQITAQVNGTPGVDDMPGKLVFSTTADGSDIPTERMRINADGSTVFSYPVTIPAGSTINGYQRNFNHISAPVNTTITDHTWVSVLASGLTITLPASVTDGMAVRISVGDFTNTVVNGNGLRIMNDPSNLTIDRANVTVTLIYDNTGAGPYGWRII